MVLIHNRAVQPSGVEIETLNSGDFVTSATGPKQEYDYTDRYNPVLKKATEGYKTHHLSREDWARPVFSRNSMTRHPDPRFNESSVYPVAEVSLFIQSLHGAFAEHVNFSLSPDIVWYMIAHEVAIHIGLNQDRYRGSFTSSDERETILVRDDSLVYGAENDWAHSINLVRDPMKEKVPQATIDLLLPTFTTSTLESNTALLVIFLNVLNNYYDLRWSTMCGIPTVRLEGEAEDWRKVVNQAETVSQEFSGLSGYFADLLPVLREIANTAAGEEPDHGFWSSIYKFGGGSGGPYVNGWITAFFAHIPTSDGFTPRENFGWRSALNGWGGFSTNQFPSHVSLAPFVWDYYGQEIPMAFAGGIFGVEHDNGFLTPKLGFGVLEKFSEK